MPLIADDLIDLEVPDHLRGYELVDGELVEVSRPGARHGRIAAQIARYIANHIEEHGAGGEVYVDAGYVLNLRRDPERLRSPDLSYVSPATLAAHGGEPRGWFRLPPAPDLVVEIDSPGSRPRMERRRIQEYVEAGVPLIWVIHIESQSATVYQTGRSQHTVQADAALEGEPVLPGFRLPLHRLFR
jgi:Uma2 family endonuclease